MSLTRSLQRCLLGDEADRRFRQDNFFVLVTGYFYAVCAAAALHGEADGVMPPGMGRLMACAMALTWATFFALVRSGWSRRLRDSSLSLPHSLAAMLLMALGYQLAGTYRSSVFPLFTLAPMLVMYRLPPRQIVVLGAVACALLAAAMLWVGQHASARERSAMAVQYVVVAAGIFAIALVARSAGTLRQRRADQRKALTQALSQARELAVRDGLTGASNRYSMEEELRRRTEGPDGGEPLSLAILDVDFFKAVNDTHGHRAGDEVLCGLVRETQAVLGEADVLARWGGEEFLLMLPGRDAGQALALVDALRRRVRAAVLAPSAAALRVSFSAGVSQWQRGEPAERAIERADRALYRAKRDGRDRCVQAEAEPASSAAAHLQPA